jgi:ABC-type dipeptide/oligopeptide/nickel transport system permease subunit
MQVHRLFVGVICADLDAVFWTSKYSFAILGACIGLVAIGTFESVPVLLVQIAVVGAFARFLVNIGQLKRKQWAGLLLVFVMVYACMIFVAELVHGTFLRSILQLNGAIVFLAIAYKIGFLCRVISSSAREIKGSDYVSATETTAEH